MSKSKILFQLSGSISCFKAAQVVSTLVQNGHEVKCVATQSALRFIGEATLEGLTGSAVYKDTFESGRMMDHIHLARWADLFVLCPATANTINKLSQGISDDLIGQLFLAKGNDKPYLVFPAMNHEMYNHPATQRSIKTLSQWGVKIFETGIGHQACGESGSGRLLEPADIISHIENKKRPLSVLITAGATREPIDDIRFISNASTGQTAATLAESFLYENHDVTYLAGQEAKIPQRAGFKLERFSDYQSLFSLVKRHLTGYKYDLMIHAAAVSDYSISKIMGDGKKLTPTGKLSSEISHLSLELKHNKKIISEIKKWSPKTYLVAFKLTSGADDDAIKTAVEKLASDAKSDVIIHNDFSEMKKDGLDQRIFRLFANSTGESNKANNLSELSKLLLERSLSNDISP